MRQVVEVLDEVRHKIKLSSDVARIFDEDCHCQVKKNNSVPTAAHYEDCLLTRFFFINN